MEGTTNQSDLGNKRKMIHYVYSNPKPVKKTGYYRFFKWFLISLAAIFLLISFDAIIESTGQFLYWLKPVSVLPFEKLESKIPDGKICHIDCDTTIVHQGIVYHDSKIDVYETMRFDRLIKTIELPGTISSVKCLYLLDEFSDFVSSRYGYIEYPNVGLVVSVEYIKDGTKHLRIYGIDSVRFCNYNYMTNRFFNKREADEQWQHLRELRKDKNGKATLPEKYDLHPKNPFEYIVQMDDFDCTGENFLTCSAGNFAYLYAADSKTLYKHTIGTKTTTVVAIFQKPMIWTYFFEGLFRPELQITGFDGRSFYSLSTDHQTVFSKKDTSLTGSVEHSSISANTSNGIVNAYDYVIWNGKNLIDPTGRIINEKWSNGKTTKPRVICFTLFDYLDGTLVYMYCNRSVREFYKMNCKAIGCFQSEYFIMNPRKNELMRSILGLDEVTIFILEKSNGRPFLAIKYSRSSMNVLYALNTRNIDETIEDVYMTREDERPVFYFFGKSSIFRWENSADGLINLKPRLLLLDETKLNAID